MKNKEGGVNVDRYLITDGTRYIAKQKNGQYVADENKNKALVLPRNEAEKVLKNNLSRAFRKIFRLQKTEKEIVAETPLAPEDEELVEGLETESKIDEATHITEPEEPEEEEYLTDLASIMSEAEKYLTPVMDLSGDVMLTCDEPVKIDESIIAVAKGLSHEDKYSAESPTAKAKPKKKKETKHFDTPVKQNEQFLSDMRMMAGYFKDAELRKKQLQDKLERIEKEIVDIRHYMEFKSLNACDGYNAYKMMRQRLIARRECKNELRVMEVLTMSVFTSKDIAGIENIIDSFDTVTYKPRVLTGLFE